MPGEISEFNLIAGIRSRDNFCFEYLIRKASPQISTYVLNNGGSNDDVKDLLHDGLVIVYENISHGVFKENAGVVTYFYSICKNRWLNYLNRRKSRGISIDHYPQYGDILLEEEPEEEHEKIKYVESLLMSATDRCKEILIAYYYDNLSMSDIAGKFGYTNADNAKSQKSKCMEKLRRLVKDFKTISQNDVIGQ